MQVYPTTAKVTIATLESAAAAHLTEMTRAYHNTEREFGPDHPETLEAWERTKAARSVFDDLPMYAQKSTPQRRRPQLPPSPEDLEAIMRQGYEPGEPINDPEPMTTPRPTAAKETPLRATFRRAAEEGDFFAAAPVTQKPESLIRNRQYSALREAIANGPAALLEFAKKEQKKRTDWAGKQWKTYRLFKPAGCQYAAGVVNPNGVKYTAEVTTEGVTRFLGCPDQQFLDNVNAALRGAGLAFRVEGKHRDIIFLRERAAWANELVWINPDEVPVQMPAVAVEGAVA